MLGIDLLFVWICYLKLIGKSIFVFGNNYNLDARLKVQLTPNLFFFRLFKSSHFADHHCEEIIVVTIFVNLLYPNDTRPEARKSRKQCADLCEVGHRAVLRSQVHRFCKNLGFSWPVRSFPSF